MADHSHADIAGLRHVSDAEPGIERRRAGRGFVYRDPQGRAVRDAATLERIRALAIPPAWREVWICMQAQGHMQATGRDARGRKQYRYHRQWQRQRSTDKFARLRVFGQTLPRLRRRLRADLKRPGLPHDKVVAIVIALLGETLLRIGNDVYARDNKSYGLTTLRDRHVNFLRGGRAQLNFRGKGGATQDVILDDARLTRLVRRCRDLPGQTLFQYRDDTGKLQPIDSGDVNAYLCEATGERFSAKDFRTWGGTLAAFHVLAHTPLPRGRKDAAPSERDLAAVENEAIKQVASLLGNTAAVCRKSYVDPQVLAGWRTGDVAHAAAAGKHGARTPLQWERALLRLLE